MYICNKRQSDKHLKTKFIQGRAVVLTTRIAFDYKRLRIKYKPTYI